MPLMILISSCMILVFVAQATEGTKFVTVSALIFSSRRLESVYVFIMSTFITSVFTLQNLSWVKFLLIFIFTFLVRCLMVIFI